MIKIGDRVKFINDIGVGRVVDIKGAIVTVEREDGFNVPAIISDLVVVHKEDELKIISKIGLSDERPGRKRNKEKKESSENTSSSKLKAYARYGKVSIVPFEDEDDEIIDIHHIKEQYIKNMAAVNQRELDVFGDEIVIEDTTPNIKEEEVIVDIKPKEIDRPKPKSSAQKSKNDIEIIDLHSHEVLETEVGLSSSDILACQLSHFKGSLDGFSKAGKKGRVVYIHGVGKGILKHEMQKILRREYPSLSYQDASFSEYGYGAIMVIF